MHKNLTYTINGCLFKVHSALGNIWHEEIYEKALEKELRSQGLKAECQNKFQVSYFGKSLGYYQADILVNDKVIIELKVAPKIIPLHKAQLISYLKGYNKPLGILANFGEKSVKHQTFPNKPELRTPLRDDFDFEKIRIEGKEDIKDLLITANRILITLGPGYLPQIYRRAFHYELKSAEIEFRNAREMSAEYQGETLGAKEVNFYIVGDMLLSIVAVRELDDLISYRFWNHI